MQNANQSKKIQLRGHCQACGRLQAVRGAVAKHGYEVKNRGEGGWFSGTCSGHMYAPVEHERKHTDRIVQMIHNEVAELRALADKYESGDKIPETVRTNRIDPKTRTAISIPWAEAQLFQQREEVRRIVWGMRNRADAGESQAQMMQNIADKYHGQSLVEVTKDEGPAPVKVGEKKIDAKSRVLTSLGVERGMVYYSYVNSQGIAFKTKMSTRSWRLLNNAA
jgi:hypothetical protein